MIWLAVATLAAAVTALLMRPLWRRRGPTAAPDADLAFHRDQLAEIERDLQLGTLTAAQADAARIEVQRRLLAAASPLPGAAAAGASALSDLGWRPRLAFAAPLIAILIAVSLWLYLERGAPDAPSAIATDHTERADLQEFVRLIDQLKVKLKDNPRDIDGWLLLARSLRTIERSPEAAEAYLRALALSGGRADIASAYGELLVEMAQGAVTPEALDLFRQALARESGEPRARFYIGLAKTQSGDTKGALEDWRALVRDAPPDAPYLAAVREQIAAVARSAGLPAPAAEPRPSVVPAMPPPGGAAPRGPSAADMAAAATMAPEDRQAMIRGMVDGLAARLQDNPADVDGWLRLSRAYGVLGETARARDALGSAAQQAPQRLDVLTQYAQALYTPERAADKPPPEFVAVMRQILALEPTNAQALWFVGNDLAAAGDRKQAAVLFKRLLDRLPPNAPLRPQVQRQLEAVGG